MSRCAAILVLAVAACGTTSTPPDASSDASSEAGTLRANGTLSAWQATTPLPHARANFCAAVVGSYVVAIGGNYPDEGGFTKLDEILAARFHDDGTLDPWTVAGHAPSPVTECTAAGDGDTLFLVDGIYDDASKQGHVFSGTLQSDGTFGALAEMAGTFPTGVDFFDDLAFASPDRLFVTTSKLTGSCALDSVPRAATPTWTDVDWLSEFRGRPQWATALAGGLRFVYVLGGYSDADAGNVVLQTGAGASVAADGTTGASFSTTSLPKPTTFGMAASADDWVFVLGGRDQIFGSQPRPDVISAQAGSSGALGAWGSQNPLPAGLSNGCAVVAGNFLYVLGGAASSAVDTVYAAQVRF